ncbi:hypothetical protein FRC08_003829 [Ceratobasidium sp. 394]|nr:hypothetical protein FRC08_003829 [Ceratobasidium sp. 394]
MLGTSSNVGQAAGNAENTPNPILDTANEGNPENQAEIGPVPQTPTLTPGQATPNDQPEINPTPPVAEGTPLPEHAPTPVPNVAPGPEVPFPDDENDEVSPLMKGAGGFAGILVDDEDEEN